MQAVDTPTIAAAGSYTPYMNFVNTVAFTMPAGNITIANPVYGDVGQVLTFFIKQDSVGGRTITWGSAFKKNLTLSAGANAQDIVMFGTPDGTTWYQLGSSLNVT
jgi:hypothetical protein